MTADQLITVPSRLVVVRDDPKLEDRYGAQCPVCPWSTRGWVHRDLAAKRMQQHLDEHASGVPMIELRDYERSVGVLD